MKIPDVTISATSNGTRTAIVMLTDLNAIEKKNPGIKNVWYKKRELLCGTSHVMSSTHFLLPQAIEMLMTITEIAAVIANA